MITKSDLISALGTLAAVAKEADCSKQAVAQWSERIPLRSAVCIARKGRWSLEELRPDLFGPPPVRAGARASCRRRRSPG
ncbi:helix-turn-helix domain-containing protein [Thiorhodococcus mannitoliphagus]|uniref:Helix-turn-helix domain-containing protein n=1 Tax=Thiorhodococcus mannitoliphagus TaxID=329406 RepID=A0A6P1E3N7_9GAMM|nr:Cro/CI family transcriptional regulator [Thiorhodococcus mannitoliphagus]NEX23703.1 helix-turn-helix domain-containing protein [Thiorhodococcus mannitoliphagus]